MADDADLDDGEPIAIPIEETLDLHPIAPRETREVVAAYLEEAVAIGLREIRIIHGRGRGVQRSITRSVLQSSPFVLQFCDATPDRGGWGATVVELASPEELPTDAWPADFGSPPDRDR